MDEQQSILWRGMCCLQTSPDRMLWRRGTASPNSFIHSASQKTLKVCWDVPSVEVSSEGNRSRDWELSVVKVFVTWYSSHQRQADKPKATWSDVYISTTHDTPKQMLSFWHLRLRDLSNIFFEVATESFRMRLPRASCSVATLRHCSMVLKGTEISQSLIAQLGQYKAMTFWWSHANISLTYRTGSPASRSKNPLNDLLSVAVPWILWG